MSSGLAGGNPGVAAEIGSLERRYDWLRSVEGSVLTENISSLIVAFALALALLYLVLGAQFESFLLPALLLTALPLSFSGISLALALSGKPISFDSALGIIGAVRYRGRQLHDPLMRRTPPAENRESLS